MGQIADFADLGHPRAALEGVQIALQGIQVRALGAGIQPALQCLARGVEDIETFLEEDFHQLGVTLDHHAVRHRRLRRISLRPDLGGKRRGSRCLRRLRRRIEP
ncbi:hypothetical protein D3C78_1638850 [compost metagenome]